MVKVFFKPNSTKACSVTNTYTNFRCEHSKIGVDRTDAKYLPVIPATVKRVEDDFIIIGTKHIQCHIKTTGFLEIKLEYFIMKKWEVFFEDSQVDAYRYFVNQSGETASIIHSAAFKNAEIYGLGETGGSLNHQGKRITFEASDSMGYSAKYSTYSLYKHFPYYILKIKGAACGILYDDLSTGCEFDFNHRVSAFRGSRRVFSTQSGFLDFYVCGSIAESSVLEVMKNFGKVLLGRPIVPPQWALGYIASSMSYSDSQNAAQELLDFPQMCKTERKVPCSGFYLSSGYTMNENFERHVFTWTNRIPNPEKVANTYAKFNLNMIPNVKPWFLLSHPQYTKALDKDLFLPEVSLFWKGLAGSNAQGQYFDFRKPATQDYWISMVRQELVSKGYDKAIWNDNNEYEVESRTLLEKPLQSLLMARSSLQALKDERKGNIDIPLVVSRSGCLGIHRYAAQTWSGDNSTTWDALRYNITMSLNLSLALWVGNGFDVGGFSGKKVSEELFCRWCEVGIFFPRFTIHSAAWKEDLEVNTPWMFPSSAMYIKSLIEMRHQLIPLLNSCHIAAYLHYEPIVSSPYFHNNFDVFEKEQQFNFFLGKNIFVTPIVSPKARILNVRFPSCSSDWIDFETGDIYEQKKLYKIDLSVERKLRIPFFVQRGTGIILAGSFSQPRFKNGNNIDKNKRTIYMAGIGDIKYSWYERTANNFVKYSISAQSDNATVTVKTVSMEVIANTTVTCIKGLTMIPSNFEFKLLDQDSREIVVDLVKV